MSNVFPPTKNVISFKKQLSRLPESERGDAVASAWAAHLEGKSAIAAVVDYTRKFKRHNQRHIQIEMSEDGQPYAMNRDGTRLSFPVKPQQAHSSATTDRRNSLRKAG